ncbi:MAG: hypothetical protein H6953_12380 [Chromatiaceae bacterium]|nr:hypothetical protein [Chromatiaceae bacterium]MCP5315854.1 hypothetical protein [Chromatiaceae bacterium]
MKADVSGAQRDSLLHKLRARAAEVKREQDAGVSPARFGQLEILRQGLEAAAQVVAVVWHRHHPRRSASI